MNIYYLTKEGWDKFNELNHTSLTNAPLEGAYQVYNDEILKLSQPGNIVIANSSSERDLYNGYPLYKVLFKPNKARDLAWAYIRAYLKVYPNGINNVINALARKQVFNRHHNGFRDVEYTSNILPPLRIWAGSSDHPDWNTVNNGIKRWFSKKRTHQAFYISVRIALKTI